MPSPTMTVAVLVVLWLVVLVPMVLRRFDERRRERSVDNFGQAMRALGRRSTVPVSYDNGPDVFVPQRVRRATAERRPVPAAQEALMFPPDRSELSAARAQMLARRRRSLTVLVGGSVVFGALGVVLGGLLWIAAGVFLLGVVGYLWFLRSQALRDRSRRENRQLRASARRSSGWDATADPAPSFEDRIDSTVRIDDDDIELMSMDTMDLTGLYEGELEPAIAARRAS